MAMTKFKGLMQWPFLLSVILLAGCSAHPGAGTWLASDGNTSGYSRLVFEFDGKAEFFAPNEEKSVRRCFWGGESKEIVSLKCIVAANTEVEEHYRFKVTPNGEGILSLGGSDIGLYQKQPE